MTGNETTSDVYRLMAAVSKAAGRTLDPSEWDDDQIMNHGCQILNRMGYGPMFDYDTDIYGPFSFELSEEFERHGAVDGHGCDIPQAVLDELSTLLSKGIDFLMAYNTLIVAYRLSPNKSREAIRDWIVGNEPEYERFYDEAFEWLQEHRRESRSLAIAIFHGSMWQ